MPDLQEATMLLRSRADSYRWLAEREPYRRTLTVAECYILAREADLIAGVLERGAATPKPVVEEENADA